MSISHIKSNKNKPSQPWYQLQVKAIFFVITVFTIYIFLEFLELWNEQKFTMASAYLKKCNFCSKMTTVSTLTCFTFVDIFYQKDLDGVDFFFIDGNLFLHSRQSTILPLIKYCLPPSRPKPFYQTLITFTKAGHKSKLICSYNKANSKTS